MPITVETDEWEERKDGSVRIAATIHVARDRHKPIVLGKGGAQMKRIGAAARAELARLLERRVHLFLHVRVTRTGPTTASAIKRCASSSRSDHSASFDFASLRSG